MGLEGMGMIYLALIILPTIILIATFERALLGQSKPLLLFAFLADVLANYGGLLLLFLFGKPMSWPKYGEWTFSKRLPRLCQLPGWRGRFARRCKIYINKRVPGHV